MLRRLREMFKERWVLDKDEKALGACPRLPDPFRVIGAVTCGLALSVEKRLTDLLRSRQWRWNMLRKY